MQSGQMFFECSGQIEFAQILNTFVVFRFFWQGQNAQIPAVDGRFVPAGAAIPATFLPPNFFKLRNKFGSEVRLWRCGLVKSKASSFKRNEGKAPEEEKFKKLF